MYWKFVKNDRLCGAFLVDFCAVQTSNWNGVIRISFAPSYSDFQKKVLKIYLLIEAVKDQYNKIQMQQIDWYSFK